MMENNKIKLNDVKKIIPEIHYNASNSKLKEKYTEWCLKKYKIDGKMYVVISIHHPNNDKIIYINANGDQIIYELDDVKYNQYIVDATYWYAISD